MTTTEAHAPIVTSRGVILPRGVGARIIHSDLGDSVLVDLGRDGLDGTEGVAEPLFVALVTLARAYAASIGDDATASCTLQGLAENLELGWN